VFAQSNNNESIYNWFDKTIGKETLGVNNGVIHTNYDRTLNGQNRYFDSNKFIIGNVNYDAQDYFNVNLKYDIYNDELVLKPHGESDYININLTKEKVKTFTIYNTKFINLNLELPQGFSKGYYEENLTSKSFIFYIKHYKEKKELLKERGAFIEYFYKNEFILFSENKFNKINSKSEILKLFPNHKNEISNFHKTYRDLKKENELKFMKNLMTYINNLLQNNSTK
jgi:hypothetical protein